MQPAIRRLQQLGPLPPESTNDIGLIQQWQDVLATVIPPLCMAEAQALCKLFGPDGCFGLAWSLIPLIESATGLSDEYLATLPVGEWSELLITRRKNAAR